MTEKQLDVFFDEATARLQATSLSSLDSSSITPNDIRGLILKTQTETPGYVELQESIRGRAKTASADRMDQAARETYARLLLEATCKRILVVAPKELDDSALEEFFAICTAAVRTEAVQEHLRRGTPLFGTVSSGKFPQDRMVQIQKLSLESLGLDGEKATELIRERFLLGEPSDDPLSLSFDAMAKNLRNVLQEVTERIMSDESNDGTTRVVSVQHSEKIIDAETGEELLVDVTAESAPTTERIHAQSIGTSASLLAQTSQLQKQMRDQLLAMGEVERNDLLEQADRTANEVLNEVSAIENINERVRYLASLDPGKQRLMALKKVWEAIEKAPASALPNNE